MTNIVLKKLVWFDIGAIISYFALRIEVYIFEFKRKFSEEFSLYDLKAEHYVFINANKVIGIARVIYKNNNTAELGRIAICRQYRGKGYGNSLVKALIQRLEENNIASLSLFAADRNLTKFYQQLGFSSNGEVYFSNIPYVNMIKELT